MLSIWLKSYELKLWTVGWHLLALRGDISQLFKHKESRFRRIQSQSHWCDYSSFTQQTKRWLMCFITSSESESPRGRMWQWVKPIRESGRTSPDGMWEKPFCRDGGVECQNIITRITVIQNYRVAEIKEDANNAFLKCFCVFNVMSSTFYYVKKGKSDLKVKTNRLWFFKIIRTTFHETTAAFPSK